MPRHVDQPNYTNSLGITSIVLGVVSLPFLCMPCIGYVGVGIGCIGMLLGVVGLFQSLSRGGYGIGFPIGGITLNLMSALVGVLLMTVLAGVIAMPWASKKATEDMERVRQQEQKQQDEAGPAFKVGGPADGKVDRPKQDQPKEGNKKERPTAPPGQLVADRLLLAREKAAKIPDIEVGASRPEEVRQVATALTEVQRAAAVLETMRGYVNVEPRDAASLGVEKASAAHRAAKDVHEAAVRGLDTARRAALDKALADASAEAARRKPVPKTGPAQEQIKAKVAFEKLEKELRDAARRKVEADYAEPE